MGEKKQPLNPNQRERNQPAKEKRRYLNPNPRERNQLNLENREENKLQLPKAQLNHQRNLQQKAQENLQENLQSKNHHLQLNLPNLERAQLSIDSIKSCNFFVRIFKY